MYLCVRQKLKAMQQLRETSTEDLLTMIDQLQWETFPEHALIRRLASIHYRVPVEETTVIHILGLSPLLAGELARRVRENEL